MPTNANKEAGSPDPFDGLTAVPFNALVSRRLQTIRRERGLSQHDLAVIASDLGLVWNRVVVANVERRARTIPLPELLLLLGSLGDTLEGVAGELKPDEKVQLTEEAWATQDGLLALFRGQAKLTDRDLLTTHDISTPRARMLQAMARHPIGTLPAVILQTTLWPEASPDQLLSAHDDSLKAAEIRAGEDLRVEPLTVSILAHREWGHGLTAERDRRISLLAPANTPDGSLRVMRGQVARRLAEELEPLLPKAASKTKGAD